VKSYLISFTFLIILNLYCFQNWSDTSSVLADNTIFEEVVIKKQIDANNRIIYTKEGEVWQERRLVINSKGQEIWMWIDLGEMKKGDE